MAIAARQGEDGTWSLLESKASGKWRSFEHDLEDEDLSERIAELIEEGDLDANEEVLVVAEDGVRRNLPARALCSPDGLVRVGFVLGASAPVGGRRPAERY